MTVQKKARFAEGESVDVQEYLREHGNPEAADAWGEMNEKYGDKLKTAVNLPADVERYVKETEKSNPDYDEAQVWAVAWSRFCRFKNPGSDHCKKSPGEYFPGREASEASMGKTAVERIGKGKNGYIAMYRGKKIEVMSDTLYEAQTTAATYFKVRKSWEVHVVLAEKDGKQVYHTPTFASETNMKTAARPLWQIAAEIRKDWRPVNYAAKPYLDAMGLLDSINDMYYEDSAQSVVLYFLSNASQWRGDVARAIKAELKTMAARATRHFGALAELEKMASHAEDIDDPGELDRMLADFNPGGTEFGKDDKHPELDEGSLIPGMEERLAALEKLARETGNAADEADEITDDTLARFEEGKPADPTENMSPEDAKEWKDNTEEYGDKFKNASDDVDDILAKFEEGKPADPTENMSPEDAAEWKKQNEEHKDEFKSASTLVGAWGSRPFVGNGGDNLTQKTASDDKTAADAPPPVARKALTPVEKMWVKEHLLRHRGQRMLGTPYKFAQRVRYEGSTWLVYDHDAWGSTSLLMLVPLNLAEMVRYVPLGLPAATPEVKTAASSPTGLYGFTRKIQSDCETCARKVTNSASTIAKRIYAKDGESAPFLSAHATRGASLPAQILVAAMKDLGPKVASEAAATTKLGAHHEKGGKWYVDTDFINSVQHVYPGASLEHMGFGEFYLNTPDGRLDFDRMRGQDFEGQSGRSHQMYDDKHGKVVDKAIKLMEQHHKSDKMASPRLDELRLKTARTNGLYGFKTRTATLSLNACSELRAQTGIIASDMHSRRADAHESIMGFMLKHAEEGDCMYSRLLHASYPDATKKTAAVSPRLRSGARIVVQANPASRMLYSQGLPANGSAGAVSSVAGPRGQMTYMPGPGGGLLYVDFDDGTFMGVSPKDLVPEGSGARAANTIEAWLEWAE